MFLKSRINLSAIFLPVSLVSLVTGTGRIFSGASPKLTRASSNALCAKSLAFLAFANEFDNSVISSSLTESGSLVILIAISVFLFCKSSTRKPALSRAVDNSSILLINFPFQTKERA